MNYKSFFTFLFAVYLLALTPNALSDNDKPDWHEVVRSSPYWMSKGVFNNLKTIRRWVLNSESFCENTQRHILFDRRATFLGYISDGDTSAETQERINQERQQLVEQGRVKRAIVGADNIIGYPFALSCDQPDALLSTAMQRYLGKLEHSKLWGTWDGMRIGSPEAMVSLHEAINIVYKDRAKLGRISMPEEVLSTLAGKTLIESGGRKVAHSQADARGIMQLSPAALKDCNLAEKFHFHRMAQVDCALRLMEQNHRNLKPVFDSTFGALPSAKAKQLYALLLIQAYHGGVGRVSQLMNDPVHNKAAQYFVKHQQSFSAGDIALGLIYHNLGRDQLGFASLYYMADVAVATELACSKINDLPGCD